MSGRIFCERFSLRHQCGGLFEVYIRKDAANVVWRDLRTQRAVPRLGEELIVRCRDEDVNPVRQVLALVQRDVRRGERRLRTICLQPAEINKNSIKALIIPGRMMHELSSEIIRESKESPPPPPSLNKTIVNVNQTVRTVPERRRDRIIDQCGVLSTEASSPHSIS